MRAASVVFVIETEEPSLDEDISFRNVFNLLEADQDDDIIRILHSFNSSVSSRYKAFLNDSIATDSDLTVTITPPRSHNTEVCRINREQMAQRRQLLTTQNSEIQSVEETGILYGYEQSRRLFSFIPDNSNEPIHGKIEDDVLDRYNTTLIEVNSHGRIFINKHVTFDIRNQQEKATYVMTDFISDH